MSVLPPPTEPNRSHASVFMSQYFASASASRLGVGLECVDRGPYVMLVFTATDTPELPERRVSVSIHRDGIPAVIAELQRLMGYGSEGS